VDRGFGVEVLDQDRVFRDAEDLGWESFRVVDVFDQSSAPTAILDLVELVGEVLYKFWFWFHEFGKGIFGLGLWLLLGRRR